MSRLALLVSGTGSLMEAIVQRVPVHLVIADRACRALCIAQSSGITAALVERTDFSPRFVRSKFTHEVLKMLQRLDIEYVAMAGFMTLLSAEIFEYYGDKILNTHPSLLPAFKGRTAVRDALTSGVQQTGCTIHVATKDMDEGPIVAQASVPILCGDTEAILHERIKNVERQLYPQVLAERIRGGT